MNQSLLIRYFDLKKLPPDLRYLALKQWEHEVLIKINSTNERSECSSKLLRIANIHKHLILIKS